jgi:alpha-D-ribose 1-methylphosphonate 5-triphosphate synthase subunit PhnG
MMQHTNAADSGLSRTEWMTLLAQSPLEALERHWQAISQPGFQWIRRPEYGAVMVRSRASGTGALFNLGEMTITRCALQIDTGEIGLAYVMGRSKRHAAIAALFDSLMQRDGGKDGPAATCLHALADDAGRRKQEMLRDAFTSKVDFFMTRDEATGG